MQWTLQRKISAGLIGTALGALLIDSGVLFGGGSDAAAAVGPAATLDTEELLASAPEAPTGPTLASVLEDVDELDPGSDAQSRNDRSADSVDGPFAVPDSWERLQPEPVQRDLARAAGRYELSSVMAGRDGSSGYAVINGTLVSAGSEIDGATLVEVGARHAVLESPAGVIRLSLDPVKD